MEDPMPNTIVLSADALALFKRHIERLGDIAVDDSNREPYRELARAGLMVPLHSFTRGRGALFRITDEGWDRRFEFIAPSPAQSSSLAR
jgi:hypothetical protein